jgi:thymidylate synthase (FAD)|tara:strand:+ start:490 stop:1149 length:660 start_codon:yes stop_codon:yes gene_type:complete
LKVSLNWVTPNAEEAIVEIARVSSSRKNKKDKPEKLINYLLKHKHFSPFEHGYMSLEIETSKAIGIQLIRHRSFTFQEFSQRYQDVNKIGDMFESIELRKQAEDNRQSSTEVLDGATAWMVGGDLLDLMLQIQNTYNQLLDAGVARECARMILPMCTKTKIHMTGSIRSWLGFLNVRLDGHAQKEIVDIANAVADHMEEQFPNITSALDNFNDRKGMFM